MNRTRPPLRPAALQVLRGVAEGRVFRDASFGALNIWVLDGELVSRQITTLVVRGLIRLDPVSLSPRLTARGAEALER